MSIAETFSFWTGNTTSNSVTCNTGQWLRDALSLSACPDAGGEGSEPGSSASEAILDLELRRGIICDGAAPVTNGLCNTINTALVVFLIQKLATGPQLDLIYVRLPIFPPFFEAYKFPIGC